MFGIEIMMGHGEIDAITWRYLCFHVAKEEESFRALWNRLSSSREHRMRRFWTVRMGEYSFRKTEGNMRKEDACGAAGGSGVSDPTGDSGDGKYVKADNVGWSSGKSEDLRVIDGGDATYLTSLRRGDVDVDLVSTDDKYGEPGELSQFFES